MHTHNLSQHVHRIGYHFPSAVVATVCMDLGLQLTATGNVMPVHSNAATRESKHANSEASQITINTEARDVLRDLFPNIPDNDLNQIIKTAFQKGQRKVGTAVELPLARRAQLAVVAHIRHIYTDYDRLLKTTSFHEARSAVEEPTLAKLVEWRGDDENGKTVLEDVFREVIVISDDDDSDAEEGEVSRSINRDHSIEIVSSHQRADELQMRPVNFSHPTVQDSHLDISDDEPPPGFRFIPESPKKRRLDRRGFSRYHAWDRALNRYRKGTYHQHRFYADSTGHPGPLLTARQPVQENITFDPGATCHPHITALRHVSVDPHIASKTEVLHHGQRRTLTRTLKENHVSLQRTDAERSGQKTHIRPPLISHEPSNPGTLLHLPIPRSDASRLADRTEGERVSADQRRARFDQRLNSPNTPVFVGGPTEIQWRGRVPSGAMSRIPGPPYLEMQPNPQDHILPSIETPPLPQQIRRPPSAHLDQLTRRITGGFTIRSVTPRHPAQEDSLPQGESDVRIPASKRRRVANHDPATYIEPRSDVAPIVPVGTHAKQQYVDLGNASPRSLTSQSGAPICRRYMVPVKSPYLAERYPEGSQGPFNYAQPVPEVVVDQRHYSNFKSKSTAWGHQPKHQLEQYRVLHPLQGSPGQVHVSSDACYATASSNESCNAVSKLPDTASEAGRVYESRRIHEEAGEATYMPDLQSLGHHHHHHHHRTFDSYGASRRSIYADDFVRPIDYRDDLRLVSQRQHGHVQTTGPMDSLPRPTNDHLRHHSSREFLDPPYRALINPPHTAPNHRGAGISRRADDQTLADYYSPSYYSRHETYGSSLALDRDARTDERQMQHLGYDLDQNLPWWNCLSSFHQHSLLIFSSFRTL
ncbi:hypothetical protein V6Z94_002388 [Aspergillus fumigatus]